MKTYNEISSAERKSKQTLIFSKFAPNFVFGEFILNRRDQVEILLRLKYLFNSTLNAFI